MNLKKLRKESNLTQSELAEKLNLSKNQVLRFENKQTPIPSDLVIKIADLFHVSIDYLLDHPYDNQVGYIADNRKETVRKLSKLNDEEFNRVDAYITSILDSKKPCP